MGVHLQDRDFEWVKINLELVDIDLEFADLATEALKPILDLL